MTTSLNPSIEPCDFLHFFTKLGDEKRGNFLKNPGLSRPLEDNVAQGKLFCEDARHYITTFSNVVQYEVLSLAQCIATIAISPFAILFECYRLTNGSINASSCLKNIIIIPKHVALSVFKPVLYSIRALNKGVDGLAIFTGFITWHGLEAGYRILKNRSFTVLSNDLKIRDIVYRSIGLTLLAIPAAFIPKPQVQIVALPIILGSLYAIFNNQFTVRACPQYYTMGHYYDGEDLKGHAIKTNNLLIKPIITGCYATTAVSKIAGIIFALAGTLPFTAKTIPVAYTASMIGITSLISFAAAHAVFYQKKNSLEKSLNDYADLVGFKWNEILLNMKWSDLNEQQTDKIATIRKELEFEPEKLKKFNERLQELKSHLELHIIDPDMPINLIPGWQANGLRNGVSYLMAAASTIAITLTTVAIRLFTKL